MNLFKKINIIKKKNILVLLLCTISFISLFPKQAFAHDCFFIQSLINDSNFTYVGNVINDSASMFNRECAHFENELGTFDKNGEDIIDKSLGQIDIEGVKDKTESDVKEGKDGYVMPLSFPSLEIEDANGKNINGSGKDADKAYYVSSLLYPSLNDAISVVFSDDKPSSIPDLVTKTQKLFYGGEVNGWQVDYGSVSNDFEISDIEKDNGITEDCYVSISKDNVSYDYIYKVPKGYTNPQYKNDLSRGCSDKFKEANDAEFVSWGQIAYEAVYAYYCHDFSFSNAGEQAKVGPLEEVITSAGQSLLGSLKNLLGLYGVDELVFNQGIRGSSAFYNGMFSTQWADKVVVFYFIFLAIAIALLILAIVRMLIKRNIATINSSARYDLINGIQKILVTGFILAFLFPIINIITKFNALLVQLFYSTTKGSFQELFTTLSINSNMLGALVLQFMYFFLLIFLNFTYIMRAILLALLIASSPLFIVFISLGDNTSKITDIWLKEFLANLFLQSIHALMLSFFTTVGISSRGIEQIIVFGCFIIVTNLFKGLVLGNAGDTAGKFGAQATNVAQSALSNAIGGGRRIRTGTDKSSSRNESVEDNSDAPKIGDSSKYKNFAKKTGYVTSRVGSDLGEFTSSAIKFGAGVSIMAMGGDKNASTKLVNSGMSKFKEAGIDTAKDMYHGGKFTIKKGIQGYKKLQEIKNERKNPFLDKDNSMGKTSSNETSSNETSSNETSQNETSETAINRPTSSNTTSQKSNPLKDNPSGASSNETSSNETSPNDTSSNETSETIVNRPTSSNTTSQKSNPLKDNSSGTSSNDTSSNDTSETVVNNSTSSNSYKPNSSSLMDTFLDTSSSTTSQDTSYTPNIPNSYDLYDYGNKNSNTNSNEKPKVGSEEEYKNRNLEQNNSKNEGYEERYANNEMAGQDFSQEQGTDI